MFYSRLARVALVGLLSANTWAAPLIYSNGDGEHNSGGFNISSSSVSNGFTVSSDTVAGSIQLGLATLTGLGSPQNAPVSVDWSISLTAFGSAIASGSSALLTNVLVGTSPPGIPFQYYYESTFSLGAGVALTTGNYFLNLSNGLSTPSDFPFPGATVLGWETSSAGITSSSGFPQAFSVFGLDAAGAPEMDSRSALGPISFCMIGLCMVGGSRRRATV